MLLQFFSVYDSKAEMYMRPFLFQSNAEAVRSFSDLCNDTDTLCGKHPEDFTLFHLGEFNDQDGSITTSGVLATLGNGVEYVQPKIGGKT